MRITGVESVTGALETEMDCEDENLEAALAGAQAISREWDRVAFFRYGTMSIAIDQHMDLDLASLHVRNILQMPLLDHQKTSRRSFLRGIGRRILGTAS